MQSETLSDRLRTIKDCGKLFSDDSGEKIIDEYPELWNAFIRALLFLVFLNPSVTELRRIVIRKICRYFLGDSRLLRLNWMPFTDSA